MTSYENAVLNCAVTMLTASPTLQAFIAPATVPHIVRSDGGESTGGTALGMDGVDFDTATELVWFQINQMAFPREQNCLGGTRRSGTVTLEVFKAIPAGLLAYQIIDDARDFAGSIADDIGNLEGTAGAFASMARIEVTETIIIDDITEQGTAGANPGYTKTTIEIEWYAFSGTGNSPPPPVPATRPKNSVFNQLGGCRGYFPMDRTNAAGNKHGYASIEGTGENIYADSSGDVPVVVPGRYDWAQSQALIILFNRFTSITNDYPPSGPTWTFSYYGRFQQFAPGQQFDLCWKIYGGNNQFAVCKLANGTIGIYGYSNFNGYIFPENDSFQFKIIGNWPEDLLFHKFLVTVTNSLDGSAGGLVSVYVDDVLIGTAQGRLGNYVGGANKTATLGGFEGAKAGAYPNIAFGDQAEYIINIAAIASQF